MREKAAVSVAEYSALTTLIEQQIERGKDKTIQDIEGKPKLEEVQMAEISGSDDKLVMNLYTRPQKEKKTVHRGQCEAEERSVMLDSSQNTMSLPQKKCKKVSSVQTVVEIKGSSVQMNISKMHGALNRSTTNTESEASANDSCKMGLALQPFDTSNLMKLKFCDLRTIDKSNLMKLKLRELRAIAKAQKLTKYSTLTKKDLVANDYMIGFCTGWFPICFVFFLYMVGRLALEHTDAINIVDQAVFCCLYDDARRNCASGS
ncbi:hypothetical protein PTKIN_Ptkin06aG0097900 [Pterospermum kingtungense]